MLIGVDFDNTIVSYDALIHRLAAERGLIPPGLPANKTAVRDHLRSTRREHTWTAMQGEIYGTRLAEAEAFPGVLDFFACCRERGVRVAIVSHKTRHPYAGEQHDLHAAARAWLRAHGLLGEHVYLEVTKADKLRRIAQLGCTHFIDDLPELLTEPGFPTSTHRILFDPHHVHASVPGGTVVRRWQDMARAVDGCDQLLEPVCSLLSVAADEVRRPAQLLTGGANNRAYRCDLRTGGSVLVKEYFQHAGDHRDRFASERAFYRHAAAVAGDRVPTPLGWDTKRRVGVFDFIAGSRPVEATPALIAEALDFVRRLNQDRSGPAARAIGPASEACFSLADHVTIVAARVQRLCGDVQHDGRGTEAAAFAETELRPKWESVLATVRACGGRAAGLLSEPLPPASRCLSPSDFGFHNAIVASDGALRFFDFEYAGWDDPAKLACDFFCQPEVPVPFSAWRGFVGELARALRLQDERLFAEHCELLLPVYRIKWCCILMNEFTRVGRERREYALGRDEAEARRARQLARATQHLSNLPAAA